jgi:restriction system protein
MKAGNEQTRLIEKLKAEGELRYTDQQWLLWALTESERFSPRESIHWVLDLVDRFPEEAIQVINAYILLNVQALPDLRLNGLFECVEIIRAKCHVSSIPDEVIESLSSRDFEYLVESLYKSMGYVTILTPPTKDGGYDVIASKLDKGLKTSILIDAKHYKKPVGVEIVRQIQGVVAKEGASKGVIVSTSKFTRGALNLERDDPRLELITRQEFIQLMNQYTGVDWTSRIDRVIFRSKQTHIEQQDSYVPP